MDADEALARALQEEEVAAARQQQPQPGTPDALKAALLSLIQNSLAQALSVEDAELQARARALAPLEQLGREAQEAADLNALLGEQQASGGGGGGALGLQDFLVQGLLRWFKRDFFSWVDQPACELCGCPTSGIGMVQPTAEEAQDGAGRVEAYRCNNCQQVTRFPRYAHPAKLLETRRGRCGEWAHTFLLLLRAAELDARHITDNADHVWSEYYSDALGRWVHVDACEEAWDTPLLYEGGWGKSLAHVFGSSRHGLTDVTRRYVLQPQALPSRRLQVPEAWLTATLARLSNPLRAALDTSTRREVALRDAAEALQLMSLEDGGSTAAAAASLPGRQSGAEAWRSARGEAGSQASTAQPSRARLPTPYQRANDATLPQLFTSAGRITGGACRASGEHRGGQPGQQACRAFDGSSSSKWLDFGGGGAGGTAWLEYRLLPGQDAVLLSHYDVMSADDCRERDPADWTLECVPATAASNAGQSSSSGSSDSAGWVVLDQQRGQVFSRRQQLRSFVVAEAARVPSRQWRLRITRTKDPAAANSVQLACWSLYSSSAARRALHGADSQQQQQQQVPQPPPGSISSTPLCMLYLDACDWTAIKSLFASRAGAAAGAIDAAGKLQLLGRDVDFKTVDTVQRIVHNMQQYPGNAKFWQLGTSSSKMQPVLSHPALLGLLLQLGFRPVLGASPGAAAAGSGQSVRLVADEGSHENAEAVRLLSSLGIYL